jgi:hypothetical protein
MLLWCRSLIWQQISSSPPHSVFIISQAKVCLLHLAGSGVFQKFSASAVWELSEFVQLLCQWRLLHSCGQLCFIFSCQVTCQDSEVSASYMLKHTLAREAAEVRSWQARSWCGQALRRYIASNIKSYWERVRFCIVQSSSSFLTTTNFNSCIFTSIIMFINSSRLLFVLGSLSVVIAHPFANKADYSKRTDSEFKELVEGNQHFREANQDLLKELAEKGQRELYLFRFLRSAY